MQLVRGSLLGYYTALNLGSSSPFPNTTQYPTKVYFIASCMYIITPEKRRPPHFIMMPTGYILSLQKSVDPMKGTRLDKVARLLQKDLSEILQRQTQEIFQGSMVTVTQVRVSPDLSIAKVFLSVFPFAKSDEVLGIAKTHTKSIRHELAQRVRHQLRIVPDLSFFIDDSLDYIENIERLLKE